MDQDSSRSETMDTFLNFIKLFDINIVIGFRNEKLMKDYGEKNKYILKEFDQFVGAYDKKILMDIKKSSLILPPSLFRKEMHLLDDKNFMRFEEIGYVMKYTFVWRETELTSNVEIYRLNNSVKETELSFQKFEQLFIYELSSLLFNVSEGDETIRMLIEK